MRQHAPLCELCLEEFTLIEREGRCRKCFSELQNRSGTCKGCRKISHPFYLFAACFDRMGPAQTLLNAFLSGRREYLAKDFAAYIALQLGRLSWEMPDQIVTVPELFQKGHQLVGKELSSILNCPYSPILKREISESPVFFLKKKCNIINKSVLLLQIAPGERELMRTAGWALDEGSPQTLYGMTLCI